MRGTEGGSRARGPAGRQLQSGLAGGWGATSPRGSLHRWTPGRAPGGRAPTQERGSLPGREHSRASETPVSTPGMVAFVCLDETNTCITGLWVQRSPCVMCGASRNQWEGFPSRPPRARHCASALPALPQAHLPAGLGLAASTIPQASSDNVSSLHTVFPESPPPPAPEDTRLKRAKAPGSQDGCV